MGLLRALAVVGLLVVVGYVEGEVLGLVVRRRRGTYYCGGASNGEALGVVRRRRGAYYCGASNGEALIRVVSGLRGASKERHMLKLYVVGEVL